MVEARPGTDDPHLVPPVDFAPRTMWEGCTAAELASEWSVPAVHLFARVASTNDVARGLADRGAAAGTLVVADEQTAGRGRAGRSWASRPGLGLYLSMVARPSADEISPYPVRIGLTVAQALDRWATPAIVEVKWPNDLLLGGRKLGGVLCEARWESGRPGHVVVGIGLNILHDEDDFPDELRSRATSLRASGRPISRFDVATAVVRAITRIVTDTRRPSEEWVEALARRDALLGREVEVLEPESGSSVASGRAAGIDPDGALLLDAAHGRITVRSGTIRYL